MTVLLEPLIACKTAACTMANQKWLNIALIIFLSSELHAAQ
jgi:hypothetical protein